MQIKFKRSTGSRGMISKSATYCLEIVLQASPEEHQRISQFDRWGSRLSILSEIDRGEYDGELHKAVAKYAVSDLVHGVACEFRNFNDVIRMENIVMDACKQLIDTVDELATFDGTERVVEVDASSAQLVAAG